jgi:hypothetical protein
MGFGLKLATLAMVPSPDVIVEVDTDIVTQRQSATLDRRGKFDLALSQAPAQPTQLLAAHHDRRGSSESAMFVVPSATALRIFERS